MYNDKNIKGKQQVEQWFVEFLKMLLNFRNFVFACIFYSMHFCMIEYGYDVIELSIFIM
jgi:hypothetical protein